MRADIVFVRQRVAVFMDGCFWHNCPDRGSLPVSNASYWEAKFDKNRARDERVSVALKDAGWSVVRIWEHVPVQEAARLVEVELARF